MITQRPWRAVALALTLLGCVALTPAAALEPINKTFFGGLAVDGYDPVAYFTDGRPVEGRKELTFEWQGATWRFASAAHRDLFAAAPEKYAPQFGGYCAWAVGHDYTADADPQAWKIVDGKLYLNYNREVQEKWLADPAALIAAGEKNWPHLLSGSQ